MSDSAKADKKGKRMKNLRVIGLVGVAVLALLAVVASPALAGKYESYAGGKTFMTGVQEDSHTFQAGAKAVCTQASAKGNFISGSTSITATSIVYNGCTVAGQAATVNMNGCDYNFGEPTGASSPYTVGTITVGCSGTNQIVITATTAACTIKIGAQTTTGGSTMTNNAGSPNTVTLNANITNIKYTGSGGICGGSGTEGTYSGKLKMSGFIDEAHKNATGIFIN